MLLLCPCLCLSCTAILQRLTGYQMRMDLSMMLRTFASLRDVDKVFFFAIKGSHLAINAFQQIVTPSESCIDIR